MTQLNETKRMQQLAGVINESQLDEASFMGVSLDQWWDMLRPAAIIGGSTLGTLKLLMKSTKEAIKADLKKQDKEIPNDEILNQLANKAILGALNKTTGAGENNMEEGNIESTVNEALRKFRKGK